MTNRYAVAFLSFIMLFFSKAFGSSCSRTDDDVDFGYERYVTDSSIEVSVNCSQRDIVQVNWNFPNSLHSETSRMILQYECSDSPGELIPVFDQHSRGYNGSRNISANYTGTCTFSGCLFVNHVARNFTPISCTRTVESSPGMLSTSASPMSPNITHHSLSMADHSIPTVDSTWSFKTQSHPSLFVNVAAPLFVIFTITLLVLSVQIGIIYIKRKWSQANRKLMRNYADLCGDNDNLDNIVLENLNSTRKLSHSSSIITLLNGLSTKHEGDLSTIRVHSQRPTSLFLNTNKQCLESCASPPCSNCLSDDVFQNENSIFNGILDIPNQESQEVIEMTISANSVLDLESGISRDGNSCTYHFNIMEKCNKWCDQIDNSYVCISPHHFNLSSLKNRDEDETTISIDSQVSPLN